MRLWTNVLCDLMRMSICVKYDIHINKNEEMVELLDEIEECREKVRGLYDKYKNVKEL